jgi:hypothetical protein
MSCGFKFGNAVTIQLTFVSIYGRIRPESRSREGRQPGDSGWWSECGARGWRLVTAALGRLGYQPADTMGARCNRGRRQAGYPRQLAVLAPRSLAQAEPLGCVSPSGKNRGGTPEVVRVPKGRVPQPARPRWLRNSVLRRSASFFVFLVARVERSETRERRLSLQIVPGLRFAAPGLQGFGPDRDETGHHHRIHLTKVRF